MKGTITRPDGSEVEIVTLPAFTGSDNKRGVWVKLQRDDGEALRNLLVEMNAEYISEEQAERILAELDHAFSWAGDA